MCPWFHKLRMSIEDTVPNLISSQPKADITPRLQLGREYKERLQEMSDAHERHLADIQERNRNLELQRDDIRRRLSAFASQGSATTHIEQMLLELKTQEEKNQLALDALRDQIGLIQSESRAKSDDAKKVNVPTTPEKTVEKPPLNFFPFPAGNGSLSSEISSLQMAYLQSGGSDPAVLLQIRDLQMEAMMLEQRGPKPERKEKKKKRQDPAPRALDSELLSVEMENQRLEDEILKLKLQRDKRKTDDGHLESELADMQREHLQQTAQLQAEIELLKQNSMRAYPVLGGRPPPLVPHSVPPPVMPPLLAQTRPPPPMQPPPMHPPGIFDPSFLAGGMGSRRAHTPTISKHLVDPPDALGPAPYDPAAGFIIFYDFLLGLDPTFYTVRLLTGLYSNGQQMGKPTALPAVFSEMGHSPQYAMDGHKGNTAMLSAKQPVPRVRPLTSIALVIELQASGGFNPYGQELQRMSSRGWAKLDLFDRHNQVISGRWKIPVRALPIKPELTMEQLNAVPQVGMVELYLRVVNARDADVQAMAEIDPRNAAMYQYPPLVSGRNTFRAANAPPKRAVYPSHASLSLSLPYTDYVDPPPIQEQLSQHKSDQRDSRVPGETDRDVPAEEIQREDEQTEDFGRNCLGFVVDRVKDAPLGDGSLRLTGYHHSTGQVISSRHSGVTCVTSPVKSNIKHGYFIFGEQEMTFYDVSPLEDMILVIRFYHWPTGSTAIAPWEARQTTEPLFTSEQWAVAFAVLRLTKPTAASSDHLGNGLQAVDWNTGTHILTLYHGPVPPPLNLSVLPAERYHEVFEPYGSATVRLCIFCGVRPEHPFPPESPIEISQPPELPDVVYIHHVRATPVAEPFTSTDGLDLYIDGARFLPDAATISRVTGRIFDRNYNQIGPDISTGIELTSSVFEPTFNYSVEIRNPWIPPTATLLLKVYSIDRFTLKLVLIGWAALNLFVESGTENVPAADSAGLQISLNEGAHQIRLYHSSPPTDQPLSVRALADGGRIVPCATLLVRVVRAPVDKNQQTIQKIGVPQEDWAGLGLFQARPDYSDCVYYSDGARPTQGEICLYSAMVHRSLVLVREVALHLAGSRASELNTDEEISAWIKKKMTQLMDSRPQPFDISCVSRYLTSYGAKVSVDRAKNLPWSGLTFAHCCFNPPGAYYFGEPWLKYDRLTFVENIDLNSFQQSPVWADGFKPFPRRIYQEHLTLIIHLHEISISAERDENGQMNPVDVSKKERGVATEERLIFSLGSQAWAALHVFRKGYCNTGAYQLPLYQGAPNQELLSALASGECDTVLKDLVRQKTIQFLPGASLIVRIADGRRDEELQAHIHKDVNQSYLPEDTIDSYNREPSGSRISDLIPLDRSGQEIKGEVARWFRKLLFNAPKGVTNHLSNQMKTGRGNELEDTSLPLQNSSHLSVRDDSQVGGYNAAVPPQHTESGVVYSNIRENGSRVRMPRAL
ncbi:uncharacterized protein [Ambystoma mexicanum]|uniref:uncharacterized protein n=1 Tax=Ambystoma mexicanum TaxID=8296 RepID=UPI0037E93717